MTERPQLLLEWLADMAALKREEAARATADAEYFEQTIAILRKPRDRYDTVPASDVVAEPHVDEASSSPAAPAPSERATMRPPAPAFTPRAGGRKPGSNGTGHGPEPERPSIRSRILKFLGTKGPATVEAIAEAIDAHLPSVRAVLSTLGRERKVERHFAEDGSEIGYDIPGRKPAPAQVMPAVPTCEQCGGPRHPGSASKCRKCYEATPVDLKVNMPAASSGHAPPAAQPRKTNGAASIELTGALKIIARDVLKALQIGPLTELELFQKTAWPVASIRTVVAALKSEGKVTGTSKFSLGGAGDA